MLPVLGSLGMKACEGQTKTVNSARLKMAPASTIGIPLLFRLLVGLAMAGLMGRSTRAELPRAPESFERDWIDSYLAAQVREKDRVGLSVAIVQNSQLVLAKAYGYRSLPEQRPAEPDTMFAIGSVTKQFTCACILLLAQEGKLSVNDKVAKYFPKLTRASDITVLDLMNHTSGYPDYYPLDFVDRRMQKSISADDLIQRYASGRLDFEPRTRWSYSNTGFIILGRIVEKASGRSFAQFLTSRILEPLGLKHTALRPGARGVASGFTTFALSKSEPVEPEAEGWLGAAGALFSTPSDLVKWDLALIDGKVLEPKSYHLMTTARELPNGIVTGYGCGWVVDTRERRTILRHNGAVSGFAAFNALIPSTRSAVALLCNKDGGLGSLPDVLVGLLLEPESTVPRVTGLSAVDAVRKVFSEFQSGTVDRSQFGEEFNLYLTEEKLAGASKRLKALGAPQNIVVTRARERGRMEVTSTTLSFANTNLEVLMYRSSDGRIEQFFIDEK
jgi:CubicO group peptidase (beta-lactamase class C family)